jgi:hypothetical protein
MFRCEHRLHLFEALGWFVMAVVAQEENTQPRRR